VERTIRFKRHALNLWVNGYIYGFVSKEKCEQALMGFGPHTFLCRFSESHAGQFVISFVAEDGRSVKHYLVKNNDIGTNKSLADFVKNIQFFKYILKIDPKTCKLKAFEKDLVLQTFYSKTAKVEEVYGYVSSLPY